MVRGTTAISCIIDQAHIWKNLHKLREKINPVCTRQKLEGVIETTDN
jgi:hypothetical protein